MNEAPSLRPLYLNGQIVGEVPITGNPELDVATAERFLVERGLFRETRRIAAMLVQAYSFGKNAQHIYERYLSGPLANPLGMAPFVVNGSFALEIYVKALSEIHGVRPRGHNLQELYGALNPQIHVLLEELTRGYIKAKSLRDIPDFKTCIYSIGNAFEKWRYHYENGTAPLIQPLDMFLSLDVLHAACVRRSRA